MTLLRAFWALVCFVDAHLQRGFDACFFALMRHGFSKTAIRCGIYTTYVTCVVAPYIAVYRVVESVLDAFTATVLILPHTLPFILFWGWRSRVDARHDREAERAGMRSSADIGAGFTKSIAVGYFVVMAYLDRGEPFDRICVYLGGFMILAAGYLCNTPRTPPPKKEAAAAALRAEAA